MELNAEQIKKALECCTSESSKCADCPRYSFVPCTKSLLTDALALITSQEQRIKELAEENERLRADKDYWKNRAKESESEYDKAVKRGYEHGAVDYVRAFDERAKVKAYTNNYCQEVVLLSDIDQIAKEMLEEEK